MWDIRKCAKAEFIMNVANRPSAIYFKSVLSPVLTFQLFLVPNFHVIYTGIFLLFLLCFIDFYICFLPLGHTASLFYLGMFCYYIRQVPPLFSFKSVFTLLVHFLFCLGFLSCFSRSVKNPIGIESGIALNWWIHCKKIDSFFIPMNRLYLSLHRVQLLLGAYHKRFFF